jgi:RNA 3'-terminal phosphate cyclase (ATP)
MEVECRLSKYGFYPVGGGEIVVDILPLDRTEAGFVRLPMMVSTTRGTLISVSGQALAANLPAHIAQRMANRARNLLDREGVRSEIHPRRVRGKGPGAGLFLIATYENAVAGFSSLGKKGKPSETVATEAVDLLLDHHRSGKPIDPHLADQLMLVLLLSKGVSRYVTSRITQHLKTNAELINRFYPDAIQVQHAGGGAGTVIVNPVDSPASV